MADLARLRQHLANGNVQAFLRVIRHCEGTADEAGYRRMFGGKLFDSWADHPRQAQTFALRKGGTLTSTAAGAYQFLARTWDGLVRQHGFEDFSPENQDLAAVALLDGRKALPDLVRGDLDAAVAKCAREWASLPGSPYGQPTKTMAEVRRVYAKHGGRLGPAGPKEDPVVAPLLIPLAGALVDIFTPVVKDKISKEIGRHTKPETAEQIASGLIEVAKQVTGKQDPVEAVAAAKADPDVAEKIERAAVDQLASLLPLLERMHALDEAALASARAFNAAEPLMIDTPAVKLRFVHVLSIGFVAFAGWFVAAVWETLTPELRGAIVTLMVIAGWNGVRDYWMGSSEGSSRKTAMLAGKDGA
jgi:muramidase (phage lysozyme)